MRIAVDLQGSHSIQIGYQGVIYEIRVMAEDQDNHQIFKLEGSLDTLRDFFDAGQAVVGEAMEREGKTENIGVATIGPPARWVCAMIASVCPLNPCG